MAIITALGGWVGLCAYLFGTPDPRYPDLVAGLAPVVVLGPMLLVIAIIAITG